MNEKLNALSTENVKWPENGYHYLAIGNSITLYGESSYWRNEMEMAATDADHDYYHLILEYLRNKDKDTDIMGLAYNFMIWKMQSHDRDETLSILNPYLSPN